MSGASVKTLVLADGAIRIVLAGAIEGETVDTLRRTLVTVLMHRRPARVVLDATSATVIDPAALGSLAAAAETARDFGIELAVEGTGNHPFDDVAGWWRPHPEADNRQASDR